MSRVLRPLYPGVPFHITARLQGQEPHFAGVERIVVRMIRDAERLSDAKLAAYAVMPNHLHLLIIQGMRPLHMVMQPLLRRLALMVQRRTGREGHVFERRFRESACLTPDYLRNAIAYIHLNATRKGMCMSADGFEWCSHAAFCELPSVSPQAPETAVIASVVKMFARNEGQSLEGCVRAYRAFLAWRIHVDRLRAANPEAAVPDPPRTDGGDVHWAATFYEASVAAAERQLHSPRRIDLRDFARLTLQDIAPDLPLEQLRSGDSSRPLLRVRQAFIVRALIAGYRGRRLARFLNVSDAVVSRIKSAARRHDNR